MQNNTDTASNTSKNYWKILFFSILILLLTSVYFNLKNYKTSINLTKSSTVKEKSKTPEKATWEKAESSQNIFLKDVADNIIDFETNYTSANYKCFTNDNLPQDNYITQIKQDLAKDKKPINSICSYKNQYLISSSNLETYAYAFSSENIFGKEILPLGFNFIDWTQNNEIIYSLRSKNERFGGYSNYIYLLNLKEFIINNVFEPKLIEYCQTSIQPGTSKRYLNHCFHFTQTPSSKFTNLKRLNF